MAGLVQYDSSDEDGDDSREPSPKASQPAQQVPAVDSQQQLSKAPNGEATATVVTSQPPKELLEHRPGTEVNTSNRPQGAPLGPALGPSLPSAGPDDNQSHQPLPDSVSPLPADYDNDAGASSSSPPKSPYTAARNLAHTLTLPAVPNTTIPPSPPGSPPPGLEALNRKFESFLQIKRAKGTHFNARLAASAAARNPALMDKLLGFVGIETDPPPPPLAPAPRAQSSGAGPGPHEDGTASVDVGAVGGGWRGAAQYATILPPDVWNPASFPPWAFKGALRKAQERGQRERARGPGEPVEFVPAAAASAGGSSRAGSRTGTPGVGGGGGGSGGGVAPVTGKRKTRFDT